MSITNNTAAVLYGIDDIRLEHHSVREMGDYDVLLEMYCTGICGSDVHYWKHGRIADFVLTKPMILGHESSGIVSKVGSKVKNLKPGDRVAIEPGVPCEKCSFCKTGKYNLCPDMQFCATPPYHGNLCRYYVHAANYCYKLPENVSLEEGALLEPLSVGVHACKRGNVTVGSKVLILGCGPIGLVTILTAKAMGAYKIIVTDLVANRLEVAKKLGADCCVQVKKEDNETNIITCIKDILGDLPDVTIDCSGFENTIKLGLNVTKAGGTLIIVGMGDDSAKVPLMAGLVKEIAIKGIFRYCNDYEDALAMVASGKVDVKPLITHKFKLEDTVKAFETSRTGAGNAIKVMIYSKQDV